MQEAENTDGKHWRKTQKKPSKAKTHPEKPENSIDFSSHPASGWLFLCAEREKVSIFDNLSSFQHVVVFEAPFIDLSFLCATIDGNNQIQFKDRGSGADEYFFEKAFCEEKERQSPPKAKVRQHPAWNAGKYSAGSFS